mgnify:CR=1 FL=1
MTDRPESEDSGQDSWPSSVEHGPFRAKQLDARGGFWWVVRNGKGDEIDDSGDGGFTEKSAKWIAEALNEKWERENHAAGI